ncbi:MAG: hypothetical protein IJO96_02780, partial [Oscillospiraceae bacterium]|nr:hypothetical protein [Oscillospiraceae bacterium]
MFYYIYVELRSNEEIPSSAEDGTYAVGTKGACPFGIPLRSAAKTKEPTPREVLAELLVLERHTSCDVLFIIFMLSFAQ